MTTLHQKRRKLTDASIRRLAINKSLNSVDFNIYVKAYVLLVLSGRHENLDRFLIGYLENN